MSGRHAKHPLSFHHSLPFPRFYRGLSMAFLQPTEKCLQLSLFRRAPGDLLTLEFSALEGDFYTPENWRQKNSPKLVFFLWKSLFQVKFFAVRKWTPNCMHEKHPSNSSPLVIPESARDLALFSGAFCVSFKKGKTTIDNQWSDLGHGRGVAKKPGVWRLSETSGGGAVGPLVGGKPV